MSRINLNNFKKGNGIFLSPVKCFSSFVFRFPVFSLDELKKINTSIDESKLLKDNLFLESLYSASPEFYNDVKRYNQGNISAKDLLKVKMSVLKYYIRMCTRCTPFGLFAGCGIGKIGEKSNIVPAQVSEFKSSTRLDMDYLCALIKNIETQEPVKKQLKFFPNTSIYPSVGTYDTQSIFMPKRKENITSRLLKIRIICRRCWKKR